MNTNNTLFEWADHLNETGVFPPQPTEDYPLFPDALKDVAHADERGLLGESHCVYCKKLGYYYPADKAYAPGHCYSEAGMRKYTSISKVCEWCFDRLFDESAESEDLPVWFNSIPSEDGLEEVAEDDEQ